LYLYAPASEQERLRPLFELLVSVVIARGEELAAAQPDGMLSPRLFVCLDEAGNCAAIKKAAPAGHHRPAPGHPAADRLA
jgi:hypothetical protein